MQTKLDKKCAIVTGASSGIGKAITRFLAIDCDYKVILIARDRAKLELTAEEFRKSEPHVELILIDCDVSNYKLLETLLAPFLNNVELLINSAGYVKRGTSDLCPLEFQQMLQTNLVGPFNLIQLVVPLMKERLAGRIINISSLSGVEAKAELGGYAASKFGLMGLNESLHKELAPFGIAVTAICPNLVATAMTKDVTSISQTELIPINEIIKTIEWLLSLTPDVMVKEIVLRNRFHFIKSKN